VSEDDPTLDVARDLRAIVDLCKLLHDQAVHRASHHDMPGGDALVMLAPVASPEAWENRRETIERAWLNAEPKPGVGGYWDWEQDCWVERDDSREEFPPCDDDANWEPPLQTMLFWSEAWRLEHNATIDLRPTVVSEAGWLGELIGWAYDHEPHFADFAADMANVRRRLEAVLYAGERDQHGVAPCDQCGHRLIRETDERRDCGCDGFSTPTDHSLHRANLCCLACRTRLGEGHARHDQGGLRDRWVCTGCWRVYNRDEYDELIARDSRDNATALTVDKLVERFDVTVGQVRMWALRGHVKKRGRDEYGRMLYDVADVQARLGRPVLAGE
jgi:hypothetical protein